MFLSAIREMKFLLPVRQSLRQRGKALHHHSPIKNANLDFLSKQANNRLSPPKRKKFIKTTNTGDDSAKYVYIVQSVISLLSFVTHFIIPSHFLLRFRLRRFFSRWNTHQPRTAPSTLFRMSSNSKSPSRKIS